nr:carbamoyl phosphate synthase small subunit [Actinomycetota bacterium]
GVGVLTGVDTRRLTRHIRAAGSLPCAVGPLDGPGAATPSQLLEAAQSEPGTEGVDLVSQVTTRSPYTLGEGRWSVVAYDFGIKSSILYQLARMASVEVVPASTPASEVLARRPDGVVLSNGPGDPAALPWAIRTTKELLGEVPLFGICLGHQLLATALGASTYKLPFGHHGGNHPVGRVGAWEPGGCADSGPGVGGVEVTSQNHNYAVTEEGLAEAIVTHRNLNDGVVEGISCPRQRAFSVQYHPEAGPGPHDARYLFGRFGQLMESCA